MALDSQVTEELLERLNLQVSQRDYVSRSLDLKDPTSQQEAWQHISTHILKPSHDFNSHQTIFRAVYRLWDAPSQGPIPVWIPTAQSLKDTNLAKFMASFKGSERWWKEATGDPQKDYPLLQALSCQQPEAFWPQMLQQLKINFSTQPARVYEEAGNADSGRWFPGARGNIAEMALAGGNTGNTAIVWAEEGEPRALHHMSLGELRDISTRIGARLVALGRKPVVGIADSFSPKEVASRLRIAGCKLLFTQDVVFRGSKKLPLYERVTKETDIPVVVLTARQELQVPLKAGDVHWSEFLSSEGELQPCKVHNADVYEITNILFSSGTTGDPKAIPWTHLTPIRAAVDAWAQMDVREGEVFSWPTNLGWMMGPFLIYAALFNGATIALFDGAPLGREFAEFVEAAGVNRLGVVPSIVRSWRRQSSLKGLDWGSIKCFASTGEASSAEDSHWLTTQAGYKPVIELCGGTELGGAFVSGSMLQPQAPAAFSTPCLGSQISLLVEGDAGQTAEQSSHDSREVCSGEIAILPPFLGSSQSLLNADHNKVYFQGMPTDRGSGRQLRRHGDIFERLPKSYYVAKGRSDDTMNLGGIKVSSVELERVCVSAVPAILEAAAVAVPEAGGGPDQLVMFVVPSAFGISDEGAVKLACQQAIRNTINPLFKLQRIIVTQSLPRTASNKVMRRVLRSQLLSKAKL